MNDIDEFELILDREREDVGATSCTFYVQDPYWEGEFRLISMPGVKLREPMHGWISSEAIKRMFCEDGPEIFCSFPVSAKPSEEQSSVLSTKPFGFLFQDFVGREDVKSFARLFHQGKNGDLDSMLFVNFSEKKEFDDLLKVRIRAVLQRILNALEGVKDELRCLDAEHLAESIRILSPAQALAASSRGTNGEELDLTLQFEKVLRLSLEALRISEGEGLGTIHLYEPDKGLLRLAASFGSTPNRDRAQVQMTSSGQGVVAWVALMQKALLIDDLATSPFGNIKVQVNPDVKSELAVPMVADGELVGVLNLESTREGAFAPASVRSIWYAADSAAVAFNLARKASTTRRMLSICEEATRDQEGAKKALREIAKVLCKTLGADCGDIWHYNSFLGRIDVAGATYEPFQATIRKDGWTNYVQKTKQPVWLSEIESKSRFSVSYWHDAWGQSPLGSSNIPTLVNDKLLEEGIEAELGLPIIVSADCVGVVWIKHRSVGDSHVRPPSGRRMAEAFSVASQAGLVLELVQRQVEVFDRTQLQVISETLKPYLESSTLNFGSLPLEGYIVHRPFHAHASGDFHATSKIDNSVIGLLIGDGTGKAVTGLLNAMPLITGFEAFGRSSGSTRHVIDQLRVVSRKLGLSGTALYWTFTMVAGKVWLTMTSAGHEVPILARSTGVNTLPLDLDSPALGPPLGVDLDAPQAEHNERLTVGDVLVAYTDGVSDALCNGNESSVKGRGRIMSIVLNDRDLPCRQLAEAIMTAAENANSLLDDATVCVVRYKEAQR